jgi:transposase
MRLRFLWETHHVGPTVFLYHVTPNYRKSLHLRSTHWALLKYASLSRESLLRQQLAMPRSDSPDKYVLDGVNGRPLCSKERSMILNVYGRLRKDDADLSVKEAASRAAHLCSVSVTTVLRLRKEHNENGGVFVTPRKKRKFVSKKLTWASKPVNPSDEFTRNVVRIKVHDLFRQNKAPTVDLVVAALQEDPDTQSLKRSTVFRIMKKLGFKYGKKCRRSVLIEREEIQLWRRRYLRNVRMARRDGKKIYYTDETWVNAGHTLAKSWVDTTVTSCKDAYLRGLSTGLQNPSGRGKRLVIVHIGSEDGFVEGGELVFEAKKGDGDYHDEMDGPRFEAWFQSVLPKLEPNSAIVIDNAPYHTVLVEKFPNTGWTKPSLIKWLEDKNIPHNPKITKAGLLEIIKPHKPTHKRYRVDEIAKAAGHTIIRLPPYHCELNPIELVWSQVKRYIAANNTTFKMVDVQRLVYEAFKKIRDGTIWKTNVEGEDTEKSKLWRNCVRHVFKEEERMWEIDGITDNIVDRMVITIGNDSSSSDTGTTEDSDDNHEEA